MANCLFKYYSFGVVACIHIEVKGFWFRQTFVWFDRKDNNLSWQEGKLLTIFQCKLLVILRASRDVDNTFPIETMFNNLKWISITTRTSYLPKCNSNVHCINKLVVMHSTNNYRTWHLISAHVLHARLKLYIGHGKT